MTIFVVDPSLFTLPYDFHLCNGLAHTKENKVYLIGRRLRSGEKICEKDFFFTPLFYSISEKIKWKKVKKIAKALEHSINCFSFFLLVKKIKPDIIHYQWMPIPIFDRYVIKKIKHMGISVVFTVHDISPFNNSPTSKLQVAGWEKNLEIFDVLIVHTEAGKAWLSKRINNKIEIIPHGLLSFGSLMKKEEKIEKEILFFGTIKPYKGLDTLIRSFAKITNKNDVILKIIGSAKNGIKEYSDLANTLGINEKIKFDIRFVPDDEIPKIFSSATLVIFPYYMIDASGAFLTAIEYGCPFIATDVGIFHELLSKYPEVLVPTHDIETLSQRMEMILNNETEMKKVQNIVNNIKLSIPSWNEIGEKTEKIYKSLK